MFILCVFHNSAKFYSSFGLFWIQLGKFVQDELMPQFVEVTTAASKLRNCISQEARQFGGVSLSALDRRTVEE